MHSGNFSQVRDFVLEHSQSVVQDDFGIPLAAFKPDTWNFYPFGNYLGPIAIFPGRNQPRLGELFKKAQGAEARLRHRLSPSQQRVRICCSRCARSRCQVCRHRPASCPPPTIQEVATGDKGPHAGGQGRVEQGCLGANGDRRSTRASLSRSRKTARCRLLTSASRSSPLRRCCGPASDRRPRCRGSPVGHPIDVNSIAPHAVWYCAAGLRASRRRAL